jgi:hypothetical protein
MPAGPHSQKVERSLVALRLGSLSKGDCFRAARLRSRNAISPLRRPPHPPRRYFLKVKFETDSLLRTSRGAAFPKFVVIGRRRSCADEQRRTIGTMPPGGPAMPGTLTRMRHRVAAIPACCRRPAISGKSVRWRATPKARTRQSPPAAPVRRPRRASTQAAARSTRTEPARFRSNRSAAWMSVACSSWARR